MPKQATFDVIIIGSGSAGFSAVEGAVSVGASVCVIEEGKLGGECPNFACVPSKAVLKTAKVYRTAKKAREYGIELGTLSHDFSKVTQYRKKVVETITGGGQHGERYEQIMKKLGVTVKYGKAQLLDDHVVQVRGENFFGKTIVLTTGTVDFVPPIPGLETVKYWNWKDAIQAIRQPKSLAVIGGGPVGCEIATFYASFGTRVTLLQSASNVLNREDQEIAQIARDGLTKLSVDVRTSVKILEVINARGGVLGLRIEYAGQEQTLAVEKIVLATGKRSNIQGLGLDDVGVVLDNRGNIKTTKEQRTSIRHIFAAGDVDGGMQFTHTAHHEGYNAGYNAGLLAKKKRKAPKKTDERVVPRVTFVEPEVASVGMTQAEVKDKYKKVLVGRYQVAALGRAVTENKRVGLIKIVAHPKTRKVLGGHVAGERAGEVMHEIALAMYLGATIDKLADMIHAFPTFSEGIKAAAASAQMES